MKEWTAPVATAAWAVAVGSPGVEAPEALASGAAGAVGKTNPEKAEGAAETIVGAAVIALGPATKADPGRPDGLVEKGAGGGGAIPICPVGAGVRLAPLCLWVVPQGRPPAAAGWRVDARRQGLGLEPG